MFDARECTRSYDVASNMGRKIQWYRSFNISGKPMAYSTHCVAHLVIIIIYIFAQYVSESESIISILTIVNEILHYFQLFPIILKSKKSIQKSINRLLFHNYMLN